VTSLWDFHTLIGLLLVHKQKFLGSSIHVRGHFENPVVVAMGMRTRDACWDLFWFWKCDVAGRSAGASDRSDQNSMKCYSVVF
jgi:hypothetical protein